MEGSFSNEEQSKNDSQYADIRYHVKKMWNSNIEEPKWLYVEQAFANEPDKPYRQRVFKVSRTYEGRFKIQPYTINEPLRLAGEWQKEEPLSELTVDSLTLVEGCAVTVTLMNDKSYEGQTNGADCENSAYGAKYVKSEITIKEDGMIALDRGYDENGIQVWGSTQGPYVFKKMK